jgi:hypothetical protein
LLLNFTFEYSIKKVHENQKVLKLNGIHQLLVCGDDVNVLGENVNTIERNIEALLEVSMEFGMEVNAEKLSI